jgi:FG-GAP-like repeat
MLSALLAGACSHPVHLYGDGGVCWGRKPSATVPTFGPPRLLGGDGGNSTSLTAGDMNGDGLVDLLVPRFARTSYGVSELYLGLAGGGFGEPVPFGQSSFAAPFDLDSGAVFAALIENNLVGVYAGDGGILETQPLRGSASGFAVVDLNGDGKPDLAVCESSGVETLLNLGNGVLDSPKPLGLTGCSAIAAGDLNLDGVPDLVTAFDSNELEVLLGLADGGFSTTSYMVYSGGDSVVIQDLNGDGWPDIAAAGPPGFSVFLNNGEGRFDPAAFYSIDIEYGPARATNVLAEGDFNGDCWPDVLVTAYGYSGIYDNFADLHLFLNRGDGTFSDPITIDTGFSIPIGVAAYKGATALLPSIAVIDEPSGQAEMLPNLTKP